jgi:hypothetical protein
MSTDLAEGALLDLKAQFDDLDPNDSVVMDVGVIMSLVRMALRLLELEDAE